MNYQSVSRRSLLRLAGSATVAASMGSLSAHAAAPKLRVATFEYLSGPFAQVGQTAAALLKEIALVQNAQAGTPFEMDITLFDTKGSVQEVQAAFNQVVDQGIRFITGGGNSAGAAYLVDAVTRYNSRNPGKEILYFNHQCIDPDLTNAKCSFWHFRFGPNVPSRVDALTRYLANDRSVRNVFLINQDYNFGQSVSRFAKEQLAAKRPDIKIVGDELHALGKVKDFSPFADKIKASGADSVITSNFGPDLVLLIRAAKDAGMKIPFYTMYGNAFGAPTAIGEAGLETMRLSVNYDANERDARADEIYRNFKSRNPGLEIYDLAELDMVDMLVAAVKKAGGIEPKAVGLALEGLEITGQYGPVKMRAEDHQILAPMFIQTFAKVDGKKVRVGFEGLDAGFRTEAKYGADETALPSVCKMTRPSA